MKEKKFKSGGFDKLYIANDMTCPTEPGIIPDTKHYPLRGNTRSKAVEILVLLVTIKSLLKSLLMGLSWLKTWRIE